MSKQTAVVYVRVSTDMQVEDGVSLEAQQAKLAAWCLANDYQLLDSHIDAGLSGGKAHNRPGLQAAIDQACKTKSALVVYSLSRLSRSTRDTLAIGEQLDKAGADLVSLSEKIDTTSAAGKMIFRLMAVMAEFERDQISERTKFAMAHKKANSERVGSVPFGYDLVAGNKLVENADEQKALTAMRELRSRGYSYRDIAKELEAMDIKTKSGKAKWGPKTIQAILTRAA